MNDKNVTSMYVVSMSLLAIGGAIAWGVGGMLFGIGLWITLGVVVKEIKKK